MNCDGSLFRELQGIAYKIEKHLAQASGVAPLQNGDARINSQLKGQTFFFSFDL
ncbi:hypothetical protein D3C87_1864320 [compost metagenome]